MQGKMQAWHVQVAEDPDGSSNIVSVLYRFEPGLSHTYVRGCPNYSFVFQGSEEPGTGFSGQLVLTHRLGHHGTGHAGANVMVCSCEPGYCRAGSEWHDDRLRTPRVIFDRSHPAQVEPRSRPEHHGSPSCYIVSS